MSGKWLDSEIAFKGPVPADIEGQGPPAELTAFYNPYVTVNRATNQLLSNNELLGHILKNTDIDVLLRTLGNAFFPRQITVAAGSPATPLITPNRYPRGYILINPNTTVSGVVTSITIFPSTSFAAGTTSSASINVSAHRTARIFLDITVAFAGTLSVNVLTQDPVSGNFAPAQTDIFGGVTAIGTFYADIGEIGVDENMRIDVVVTGANGTASIGGLLKEAFGATIAGPTIFLGSEDVNTTIGFPLLSGQRETLYLRENTPLFATAIAATIVNLFELQ